MHRIMLMLVAGLMVALWPADLVAQRRGPGGMAVATDSAMALYNSRLNLNDEQEVGIRQILEVQAERGREMFEAVRGQGRDAMMEMRPKMEELQAETDEQIEALLNEDQVPEYRKLQTEMREQRRSRMRERRPGG